MEENMNEPVITRAEVQQRLNDLHRAAKKDRWRFLGLILKNLPILITGNKSALFKSHEAKAKTLKNIYISVSPAEGMLLYTLARSLGAKRIIEFGTSYGISSIYLTAAVIDNGGGEFFGSELDANKCDFVNRMLSQIGFSDIARIIQGDALETFKSVSGNWDLLFLDGWKDLYLDVFKMMENKIRVGGVVLASDIDKFKKDTLSFVDYVRESPNYDVVKMSIGDGFLFAIRKNT
jgi:predicted O-methyltransferase YrrM